MRRGGALELARRLSLRKENSSRPECPGPDGLPMRGHGPEALGPGLPPFGPVLTRHIQDDEESGGTPVDIAHNGMLEGQLNTPITRRDTQRRQTEGDRAAEEGTS